MSQHEIWVDHLEDLARATREYSDVRTAMHKDIPGNYSDLEFDLGPVMVTLGGEPTGWEIGWSEELEAVVLRIKEREVK